MKEGKTIAVVGFSNDPLKEAHTIPKYLKNFYRVIPVNPNHEAITGLKSYNSISEVLNEETEVDIVNIFRPGKDCLPIVEEIVSAPNKPKLIWLQLGIRNEKAKKLAEEASIDYIEDKCIYVIHKNLS